MKKKREIIIIIWGRKMNKNACVQGDFLQCTFMRVLFKETHEISKRQIKDIFYRKVKVFAVSDMNRNVFFFTDNFPLKIKGIFL